jgi:hypothetical protein
MLRIVLPGVIATTIGNICVSVDVRIAVGIVDKVVVIIDVDVVAAVAPSAVIAPPAAAPGCSHHHADAE